jgi:hypothetical protein
MSKRREPTIAFRPVGLAGWAVLVLGFLFGAACRASGSPRSSPT